MTCNHLPIDSEYFLCKISLDETGRLWLAGKVGGGSGFKFVTKVCSGRCPGWWEPHLRSFMNYFRPVNGAVNIAVCRGDYVAETLGKNIPRCPFGELSVCCLHQFSYKKQNTHTHTQNYASGNWSYEMPHLQTYIDLDWLKLFHQKRERKSRRMNHIHTH